MKEGTKLVCLLIVLLAQLGYVMPAWAAVPARQTSLRTEPMDMEKRASTVFHHGRCGSADTLSKEELASFWRSTRDRLAGVPMEPVVEPVKEALPFRKFKVTLRSLDGMQVVAFLSIPVQGEAPAKPWPVIIATPGYGGWQQSAMPGECQRGYAILQVFPRGQGESSVYWKTDSIDKLTWNLGSPAGAYYQGAYADVMRFIDFVATRADLDSSRIALMGTSQGGGISLAVAAIDPRIRAVVAHVPFLCNIRMAARIPNSLVKKLLDKARRNDEAALRTLDFFDPWQLAPALKAPALISAGGKDGTCPLNTIRSVYDRLTGERTFKIYPELTHTSCVDFYNYSWVWLDQHLRQ